MRISAESVNAGRGMIGVKTSVRDSKNVHKFWRDDSYASGPPASAECQTAYSRISPASAEKEKELHGEER